MSFENQGRGAADSPELIDISGPEEITSTNEEGSTQRAINDRRLAQAIKYLVKEGGDDSPVTFVDRVDRIDNSLLLPLSQQGRNFDVQLFNRVLAMVSQAQLDFDEAAQGDQLEEDSSSTSNGEPSMPDSAEELPEYYMLSAAEALYRKGDGPDKPRSKPYRPMPTAKKPTAEKEEDVRREHMFKYGGPNNEVESWYKNYPASLPFPETFQLAYWESLKIDYDLSESIKQMKAEGKIVETNVPFDHPTLEQYKTLPSYESGSRFKLPKSSAIIEKEINRLGTHKNLAKVVQDLNRSNDEVKDRKYQYTPRVFLEELTVGARDPTIIRHAINTTPTKSRTIIMGGSSPRDSSNATQTSPAVGTSTKLASKYPPSIMSQACENDMSLVNEQVGFTYENAHAKFDAAAHVTHQNLRKATQHARSSTKHTGLVLPTSKARTTSPVVRKINRERTTSLERSPRRQSGVSTVPPSPDSPTKKATIYPQVVIEKRPSGRPSKSAAPAPSKLQPGQEPISVNTPKGTTKRPTKRKRSASERDYTPDPKRARSSKSSALKPPLQTRVQATPDELVHFLAEESDNRDNFGEDNLAEALIGIPIAATPLKAKPATKSKVTKARVITKKVTKKAAAAGEIVGRSQTKAGVKEIVDKERCARPVAKKQKTKPAVKAGSTRSGLRYLKE